MTLPPWKTMLKTLRRSAAALPAAGAVLGVAMAAFRRAPLSNSGDTATVAWVLAVIAVACIGV